MTIVEVLTAIAGDGNQQFRRPRMVPLVIGNALTPTHPDYDRTPHFRFELAEDNGEDKAGDPVKLSLQSYEADDWEI